MVIFGGIGHCPCFPVQPGITPGKTSNYTDIPWDESKLQKSSQKGRGEVGSPNRGLKCHATLGGCSVGDEEQAPALHLLVPSGPVPIAAEEQDGVRSEGKSLPSKPPRGPAAT